MIQFDDWRALQDAADFSRRYLHINDDDVVEEVLEKRRNRPN